MTDLKLMSYFFGIKVQKTDNGIFISQKNYLIDILKRFKMESSLAICVRDEKGRHGELAKPTYFKGIVESPGYLTSTRPNIVYGV